ncbi:olfactory receptor 14A2-like [Ornithorhynchus anatinus]|uniref:olfactory receptor 14A2-like n=1 Tax=Ornithorhynchus anatinus TaxID=9258 RepID=UPI000223FA05|nr:olfactory receptor 14A2-like [Ornithorhynchus anatinus]
MSNTSTVRGFLLLGSSEVREPRPVHAAPFLPVYPAALTGNLLVVAVALLGRRLRAPVYFFLGNLALVDLCFVSVTVPKSVAVCLTDCRSISFLSCAAQLFLVVLFAAPEFFVLTAVSYDRYAAICLPLRYGVVVGRGVCGKMAAASWLGGGLVGVLFSASTFSLSFCGSHVVRRFFCDVPSLLKITRSEDRSAIDASVTLSLTVGAVGSVSIAVSYARVIGAVLRMPAAEGRAGAFSTCLPHLLVVTVFLSSGVFGYLEPPSHSSSVFDLPMPVFYAVGPPAPNPLIYSLRNRDLKAALRTILKRGFPQTLL